MIQGKHLLTNLWVGLLLLAPVAGMALYRSQARLAAPPGWSRVRVGMGQHEVRSLLGNPVSVDYLQGGLYLIRPHVWHYAWGSVEFDDLLTVCSVERLP